MTIIVPGPDGRPAETTVMEWEARCRAMGQDERDRLPVRAAKAAGRWIAAGLPVVTSEQFEARLSSCISCRHWTGGAIPRCGVCNCTGLKLWLATEECPLPEPEKRWRKASENK